MLAQLVPNPASVCACAAPLIRPRQGPSPITRLGGRSLGRSVTKEHFIEISDKSMVCERWSDQFGCVTRRE